MRFIFCIFPRTQSICTWAWEQAAQLPTPRQVPQTSHLRAQTHLGLAPVGSSHFLELRLNVSLLAQAHGPGVPSLALFSGCPTPEIDPPEDTGSGSPHGNSPGPVHRRHELLRGSLAHVAAPGLCCPVPGPPLLLSKQQSVLLLPAWALAFFHLQLYSAPPFLQSCTASSSQLLGKSFLTFPLGGVSSHLGLCSPQCFWGL